MNQDSGKNPNALYLEFIHLQMQIFKNQGEVTDSYQKAIKLWANIKPSERQNQVNQLKGALVNPNSQTSNKKIDDFIHPKNRKRITLTHDDLHEIFNHTPIINVATTINLSPNFRGQSSLKQEKKPQEPFNNSNKKEQIFQDQSQNSFNISFKQEKHIEAINIANDIFNQIQSQQKEESDQNKSKTTYIQFYKKKFNEIRIQYPRINPNEVTRLVSKEWKIFKQSNGSASVTIKQKKQLKDSTKQIQKFSQSRINFQGSSEIFNLEYQLSHTSFHLINEQREASILSGTKIIDLLRRNSNKDIILINLKDIAQNNYINTHVLLGLQNIEPLSIQNDYRNAREMQGSQIIEPNRKLLNDEKNVFELFQTLKKEQQESRTLNQIPFQEQQGLKTPTNIPQAQTEKESKKTPIQIENSSNQINMKQEFIGSTEQLSNVQTKNFQKFSNDSEDEIGGHENQSSDCLSSSIIKALLNDAYNSDSESSQAFQGQVKNDQFISITPDKTNKKKKK